MEGPLGWPQDDPVDLRDVAAVAHNVAQHRHADVSRGGPRDHETVRCCRQQQGTRGFRLTHLCSEQ